MNIQYKTIRNFYYIYIYPYEYLHIHYHTLDLHTSTYQFLQSPGSSKSTCAGLVTGDDSVWGNHGKTMGKPFENDGLVGFNVVYYGLIRMIMGKY